MGTVASKIMTEKFNIEDTDEIIKAETERFLLLFGKKINEYYEKNLKQKNLDCEDGAVTNFLTKIARKSENKFCQMLKVVQTAKLLKIIDSFFHAVFNSKQNGQKAA